jgi:hypothetical protein
MAHTSNMVSFGLPDWPVRFVPTEDKAYLNVSAGYVDIDPSLESLPVGALMFIKLHELAHFYNNNPPGQRVLQLEMNCDKIAAHILSEDYGQTKTQILGYMDIALMGSPELELRKRAVNKYLSKWKSH